tara:strand:+ start:16 stop:168 length:153 start_codon:yes stop_codon:yes gene_type:complete
MEYKKFDETSVEATENKKTIIQKSELERQKAMYENAIAEIEKALAVLTTK